jgi:hypothetical protein
LAGIRFVTYWSRRHIKLLTQSDHDSQATAIVTERLNANKAPTPAVDPKNPRSAVNNNKDLDVDAKQDAGFFGSFFAPKTGPKKKGAAAMEAPPTNIRPQSALNERETMETEVISA